MARKGVPFLLGALPSHYVNFVGAALPLLATFYKKQRGENDHTDQMGEFAVASYIIDKLWSISPQLDTYVSI